LEKRAKILKFNKDGMSGFITDKMFLPMLLPNIFNDFY